MHRKATMDDIASVKVQLGNYLQKWERNVATWWTLYQGHTPMILCHIYNTAIRVSTRPQRISGNIKDRLQQMHEATA